MQRLQTNSILCLAPSAYLGFYDIVILRKNTRVVHIPVTRGNHDVSVA